MIRDEKLMVASKLDLDCVFQTIQLSLTKTDTISTIPSKLPSSVSQICFCSHLHIVCSHLTVYCVKAVTVQILGQWNVATPTISEN